MPEREFVLPIERCPICGARDAFQVRGKIHHIPYFGETMETLVTCRACKFKHADVMHLGEHEPMRHEFQITSDADMMVRVVRSGTGTIKIPELGVTVKPSLGSEGYVSNVEGVLNRIEAAIKLAIKKVDQNRRRRGKAKLKKLEQIRRGEKNASLIVIDPFGHSAILDERAKKRKLTKKELTKLRAEL
ncbi:MAG: ZPR1 zinc finger domain-containing protein [Hadesarchaea archaeon]|nr:ZPR1 zinc finger domain-containing protein [Hadesarchaea archaeon]